MSSTEKTYRWQIKDADTGNWRMMSFFIGGAYLTPEDAAEAMTRFTKSPIGGGLKTAEYRLVQIKTKVVDVPEPAAVWELGCTYQRTPYLARWAVTAVDSNGNALLTHTTDGISIIGKPASERAAFNEVSR